jgi:CBS domain-containing protein
VKVADLMTRHVEFLDGEAPVKEAAELMGEIDVGALPVGTADRLEGILTDRDVLYRVVARGLDPNAVKVREVASQPVIACGEDDAVGAAMDLMAAHHVRRLPVREASGRVVGWITLADLARQLLVGSDPLQTALGGLAEPAD